MRKMYYNLIKFDASIQDNPIHMSNLSEEEIKYSVEDWLFHAPEHSDIHIFAYECEYDMDSGELINPETGDVHDI